MAIVGGGIGGLFAANALLERGLRVGVYEQAPALGEVGAGVFLTPNGVRQLQRLGFGSSVERLGARIGPGSQYLRHDGTPVAPILTSDSSGGIGVFGMHRADVVETLAERLGDDVIHTGYCCTGFEQAGEVARLSFANGATVEADAVVAADGIHSTLQRHVVSPSPPIASGSVAYRGLVPRASMPEWPSGAWLMWMGAGKHFLVYPVRSGELLNYVGFVPTDRQMKESWSAPGDPDALRAEFAGWDPRVESLLERVQATFRWGLYDREPLPRWTRGRLTLLGDAAHPMLPHLGQGANQAMEDGIALATILSEVGPDRVPEALPSYERLRRERTNIIQRGARENQLRYDSFYEDLAVRDTELEASTKFRRWLYDYDVVPEAAEEARRAMSFQDP